MKDSIRIVAPISLIALAACITVNVYFPAAAVKDLSRQIEQEVQKEAEKIQSEAPATGDPEAQPEAADPKAPAASSSSLLDTLFGISPAYAQEGVAAPEVTNPAIRKIIEMRAGRVAALTEFKSLGVVGESNQGLVEIRDLAALSDLGRRAEVQRLVKSENADREALFREIAVVKKVDPSQLPKIRETYASTIREMARAGDWIQAADGTWKKK